MASSATTRRGDLHTTKLHQALDTPRSPMRRATTPRPSISPLSAKASPVAVRDVAMQDADNDLDTGPGTLPPGKAEVGADDDTGSSSLSEPEDDEEEEYMRLNGDRFAASIAQDQSVHQSLEVDSEAETERLEQTPHKTHKHADDAGKTPSKLSHTALADDILSDPPSPILAGAGAASSTSTIETVRKKRKRSDTADSSLTSADSDLSESPRKRSHSSAPNDAIVAGGKTASQEAIEDASESTAALSGNTDDLGVNADHDALAPATKFGMARKGKSKGKGGQEAPQDTEQEKPEDEDTPEELSEEAAAKSAEELTHKQTASTVFEDLAKQFTAFRERLYSERLAAMDAELEMLNQPGGKHLDYLRQVACVDARYEKQVGEIRALYRFKKETLRRTTLGERSQLHSQYFQHARELREDVMYKLGEDWYNIQRERRQSNQEKDDTYIYKFPTKKSVQIKQQAKYNQEVSILSGIAKYVGFPAAPEIVGARGDPLEEDLKAMEITKRAKQQTTYQQPIYISNRSGMLQGHSDRIAHEQFIEQHAWARPQGHIQNHGTPNVMHTPDWSAEPGAHGPKTLIQHLNEGHHSASNPYATPMPQRRGLFEHPSSGTAAIGSDDNEQPSSLIAAPPTTDRLHQDHVRRDQGSPLAVTKQRVNGGELTGLRNFSNLSGASTIDAAPDSAEKERGVVEPVKEAPLAARLMFDTTSTSRNVAEPKKHHDVYATEAFRPQEGAYGTPTPFPASSAAS